MKKTLHLIVILSFYSWNLQAGPTVLVPSNIPQYIPRYIPRAPIPTNPTIAMNATKATLTNALQIPQEQTFLAKTKAWCTTNPFACVMAGLSAVQLVVTIAGYLGSKKTKDQSQCQGDFCNNTTTTATAGTPTGPINPYTYESPDANDTMTPILRNAQTTLKDLKAKGYTVDTTTGNVTTPNGTLTPDQIAAAASSMSAEDQAQLAKIQSEAAAENAKSLATNEGEGSSETASGKKRSAGGDDGVGAGAFNMNAYLRGMMGNKNSQRGVAGLSVRAGSDNVGLKEANIFEQVSTAFTKDKILNRSGTGP